MARNSRKQKITCPECGGELIESKQGKPYHRITKELFGVWGTYYCKKCKEQMIIKEKNSPDISQSW